MMSIIPAIASILQFYSRYKKALLLPFVTETTIASCYALSEIGATVYLLFMVTWLYLKNESAFKIIEMSVFDMRFLYKWNG